MEGHEPVCGPIPDHLEGNLEGASVPDLLQSLSECRATGVLTLERDGRVRTLFVERGRIIFAASDNPGEQLGDTLLREGRIGVADLNAAEARLGQGKRLGTLLVENGALSPEDLVRAVVDQVKELTLGLMTWQQGHYRFTEGPLPTREVITLDLPTAELILEGIRRVHDWERVRRSVGPPRTLFERCAKARDAEDHLRSLGDTEMAILDQLDPPVSVEHLCEEVYASSFEVYRSLWALRVLGLIQVCDRDYPEMREDEVPTGGRLETVGIGRLLLRICRAGETGILRVWSRQGERTVHVKDGAVVFATSSDPNDGLVSYLLRRGVIGVRDRDEAVRRLLSNKRIGTILVERGSLSPVELGQYVQDQVSEIVLGLFQWERGEYAFDEGELPTLEDIVLDRSVETLVLAGTQRVSHPQRVMEGLGALSSVFRLRSDYLDILDRMEIGPVEWDLIPLLREERSLAELCDQVSHPDLVIARILWAFQLVEVIERVSEAELREREELAARDRAEAEALATEPPEALAAEPPEALATEPPDALDRVVSIPVRIVEEEPDISPPASAPLDRESLTGEESALAPEDDLAAPTPREEEPESLVVPELLVPRPSEEFPEAMLPPGEEDDETVVPLGADLEAEPEESDEISASDEGPSVETGFELAPDEDEEFEFREVDETESAPVPAGEHAGVAETDEPTTILLEEAEDDGQDFLLDEPGAVRPELWVEEEGLEETGDLPDFEMDEPGYALEEEEDAMGAGAVALEVSDGSAGETGGEAAASGEALAATVRMTVGDIEPPAPPTPEESTSDPHEAGPEETGAAEADAPAGSEVEIPDDHLEREIKRFNERHRFLFDHLKSEIGAGARNFVATCQRRAGQSFGSMFEGLAVGPEGEYDPAGLRENIINRNIEDYPRVFELLLETEFELVRDLFPPDRLVSIEAGLRDIDLRFES